MSPGDDFLASVGALTLGVLFLFGLFSTILFWIAVFHGAINWHAMAVS